jgi:multidrug efflux pump subunit AcrB
LQSVLGNAYVNDVNLFGRTWQVNLQGEASERARVNDIYRINVRNKNGDMVSIRAFAEARLILGPPGKERRITRWEHEHVLETVQQRLDQDPQAMRRRRETVEHPFGTLKMRMGATHFLMKTLPKVASEMALSVLAYNLTRVMNIVGTRALLAAIEA